MLVSLQNKLITIAAALVVLFVWWMVSPGAERYPSNGSSVILFGDSLAAGQGATEGNDIASLLSVRLGRQVRNMGENGDTTADALARVDEVLQADPHVVIVMLGGNDALRRVPVEETFTNLGTIIERIHSVGAAAVLVGEPGGLYGSRYEKEYERLVKTHRTFYVPNILKGLIGRVEYMSDAIHPNDAGYRLAAEKIAPEVERALSR